MGEIRNAAGQRGSIGRAPCARQRGGGTVGTLERNPLKDYNAQIMVTFSKDLFNTICARIADGESLRAIQRDIQYPAVGTFFKWLEDDPSLQEQYRRARERAADADAEDVTDIAKRTLAGEYDPQSARVAIDALKWSAGKRKPKVYGDKVQAELTGPNNGPIQTIDYSKLSPQALKELHRAIKDADSTDNGGGASGD
jgi:hypothetical protein